LSVVLNCVKSPIFCELESICVSSSLIAPTKLVLTSVVKLFNTPISESCSLIASITLFLLVVDNSCKSPN
jgi:hypothetical protein